MPLFRSTPDARYLWTQHSRMKMRHYRLTEPRIIRVIRHPARVEEGILEGAIACMQPAGGKQYSEIWVMYVMVKSNDKYRSVAKAMERRRQKSKIRIITAWRYPGRSPERDPVPQEVLREIRSLLL